MFDWFKKKTPINGPDFSDIDSREKVELLVTRGELSKLYLVPPEFGGEDVAANIVYAPNFAVEIKNGIDTNTIGPLVSDGKVTRYTATPKYQGKSFVPNAIEVRAYAPADFGATIKIWGDALGTNA